METELPVYFTSFFLRRKPVNPEVNISGRTAVLSTSCPLLVITKFRRRQVRTKHVRQVFWAQTQCWRGNNVEKKAKKKWSFKSDFSLLVDNQLSMHFVCQAERHVYDMFCSEMLASKEFQSSCLTSDKQICYYSRMVLRWLSTD